MWPGWGVRWGGWSTPLCPSAPSTGTVRYTWLAAKLITSVSSSLTITLTLVAFLRLRSSLNGVENCHRLTVQGPASQDRKVPGGFMSQSPVASACDATPCTMVFVPVGIRTSSLIFTLLACVCPLRQWVARHSSAQMKALSLETINICTSI